TKKSAYAPDEVNLSRRTALAQLALVSSTPLAVYAAESSSVLETRLQENSITPPTYGMESAETDIFYPQYFKGSWKAISKTKDIQAPCGLQLFTGGKAGFDSATQKEVIEGDTLQYRARFIEQIRSDDASSSYIAADREFNLNSITKQLVNKPTWRSHHYLTQPHLAAMKEADEKDKETNNTDRTALRNAIIHAVVAIKPQHNGSDHNCFLKIDGDGDLPYKVVLEYMQTKFNYVEVDRSSAIAYLKELKLSTDITPEMEVDNDKVRLKVFQSYEQYPGIRSAVLWIYKLARVESPFLMM
ncbi:hypothetical protein ACHAWC_010890, partial [Mediolabrus comicus]